MPTTRPTTSRHHRRGCSKRWRCELERFKKLAHLVEPSKSVGWATAQHCPPGSCRGFVGYLDWQLSTHSRRLTASMRLGRFKIRNEPAHQSHGVSEIEPCTRIADTPPISIVPSELNSTSILPSRPTLFPCDAIYRVGAVPER
jgi:hypothetical protein